MNATSLTLTYGLDNIKEVDKIFFSINSLLLKNDISEIEIIIFVKNTNLKIKLHKIIFEKKTFSDFNISIIVSPLKNVPGQYYWLLAPFYTKSQKIIQLDNDIIVNANLSNIVFRNKKSILSGVKVWTTPDRAIIKNIIDNFGIKYNKRKYSNWINSGVVLINRSEFVKKFISKKNLEEMINWYYGKSAQNDSDEGFIFIFLRKQIEGLDGKYNLRIQSHVAFDRYIKGDEYIFHYNLGCDVTCQDTKFDFSSWHNNIPISYEDINHCLVSRKSIQDEKSREWYKSYSERIVSILNKLVHDLWSLINIREKLFSTNENEKLSFVTFIDDNFTLMFKAHFSTIKNNYKEFNYFLGLKTMPTAEFKAYLEKEKITYKIISDKISSSWINSKMIERRISTTTLARLYLFNIFPEISFFDKIIYVDADTLFRGKISKKYLESTHNISFVDVNKESKKYQWTIRYFSKKFKFHPLIKLKIKRKIVSHQYFNAGVIIINDQKAYLNLARKILKKKLNFDDQTLLNYNNDNQISVVNDISHNLQLFKDICEDAIILHLSGIHKDDKTLKKIDSNIKTPEEIIRILVESINKNSNNLI